MCTNRPLVTSIECYMEDMVDCFEDFVKKSLFIVTLAVGALVGMLVYLMKTINDRGARTGHSLVSGVPSRAGLTSDTSFESFADLHGRKRSFQNYSDINVNRKPDGKYSTLITDITGDRHINKRRSENRILNNRALGNRVADNLVDSVVMDSRVADNRVVDGRDTDTRSIDNRVTNSRAINNNTTDSRVADSRFADKNATDSRFANSRATDSRFADSRATDSRFADSRAMDSRNADSRIADSRIADSRVTDSRVTNSSVADSRFADNRAVDRRESNVMDRRESNVMDRRESNVMDRRQSNLVDRRDSNVLDRRQSRLADSRSIDSRNADGALADNPRRESRLVSGITKKYDKYGNHQETAVTHKLMSDVGKKKSGKGRGTRFGAYSDSEGNQEDSSLTAQSSGISNKDDSSKCCLTECPKNIFKSCECVKRKALCAKCSSTSTASCEEKSSTCSRRRIYPDCASSSSRLVIPSMPTCTTGKRQPIPFRPCTKAVSNRYSCCSVCCDDDPR